MDLPRTIPLDIKVVDQFGNLFTDFDYKNYYKSIYYAHLAIVSRDLSSFIASPLLLDPYRTTNMVRVDNSSVGGTGMGGMGGGGSAASGAGQTVSFANSVIQPKIIFPTTGQYIAFIEFWPRAGDQTLLTYPLNVGTTKTPAAALKPDIDFSRTVGGLNVIMKTEGTLKSGQYNYIKFEARNSKNELKSKEIGQLSGINVNLYIVDEAVTLFIKPDFIKRSELQYSVFFPKPGLYKAWFEFVSENTVQRISYVLDVK
jgi:hypothetical protein